MTDYRTHADLLEQVEHDQATRDNVRRILSAPLTEQELDAANFDKWRDSPWPIAPANHAHRYSACQSGPCKQGRRPCPSPEACQRADDTRPPPRAGDMLRVVVLVLACWAAVAFTLASWLFVWWSV